MVLNPSFLFLCILSFFQVFLLGKTQTLHCFLFSAYPHFSLLGRFFLIFAFYSGVGWLSYPVPSVLSKSRPCFVCILSRCCIYCSCMLILLTFTRTNAIKMAYAIMFGYHASLAPFSSAHRHFEFNLAFRPNFWIYVTTCYVWHIFHFRTPPFLDYTDKYKIISFKQFQVNLTFPFIKDHNTRTFQ